MHAAALHFYAPVALTRGFLRANADTLVGVVPDSSSGMHWNRPLHTGQPPMQAAASRSSILPLAHLLQFALQILNLFLQRDHLQLTTNHDLFELLQIEDLLLQFGFRFLQVAHYLFVGAHIAQDTNGADHLAISVTQGGSIEGGGNDFAGGAAGIETSVTGRASCNDFAQGGQEFSRLLGTDEAGKRLLQHFVRTKTEQFIDGIISL